MYVCTWYVSKSAEKLRVCVGALRSILLRESLCHETTNSTEVTDGIRGLLVPLVPLLCLNPQSSILRSPSRLESLSLSRLCLRRVEFSISSSSSELSRVRCAQPCGHEALKLWSGE